MNINIGILRAKITAVLIISMLLQSGVVKCNEHRELSLSKKVQVSDIVLIAQVASVYKNGCVEMNSCARLKVLTMLKGGDAGNITLLFDGLIAESDPLCCELGRTYLLFLKKVDKTYYESSNGPFGAYLVK